MKNMKKMVGITVLGFTLAGLFIARSIPAKPKELEIGQMGATVTSDPDSTETLIYADKFPMGFNVIPIGTTVRYLGPAPRAPDRTAPMIRVSIESGAEKGLICSISKADFRPAPQG